MKTIMALASRGSVLRTVRLFHFWFAQFCKWTLVRIRGTIRWRQCVPRAMLTVLCIDLCWYSAANKTFHFSPTETSHKHLMLNSFLNPLSGISSAGFCYTWGFWYCRRWHLRAEKVFWLTLHFYMCYRPLGSFTLSWRSMGPMRASKLPLVGDCWASARSGLLSESTCRRKAAQGR